MLCSFFFFSQITLTGLHFIGFGLFVGEQGTGIFVGVSKVAANIFSGIEMPGLETFCL